VAQFGARAKFELPAEIPGNGVQIYDSAVPALSVEKMVEIIQGMIEGVRAYNADILCDADLSKYVGSMTILNSQGGRVSYSKTTVSAGLHANWIRGTDMLDVYEGEASCCWPLDCEALVERVLEKIRLAERTATLPTGRMPVIFTPKGVAGTLLASLRQALNGKVVLEGASPLGDRLGETVFDERLSLYDDGRIDYAVPTAPCDDEGVATRRTALIEKGVVRAFYYDLQTAGLAGVESTGNAGRGLGSLPSPVLNALIFAEGDMSYEEMLANVEEGLIVDQTIGAWAGNVLAGEFSGNVHLGYKVTKGEIVGRVKDSMVAGNVFSALAGLAAVGDEAVWLGGSLKVPYLYFRSLGVASK
jgi:PmbA protein